MQLPKVIKNMVKSKLNIHLPIKDFYQLPKSITGVSVIIESCELF